MYNNLVKNLLEFKGSIFLLSMAFNISIPYLLKGVRVIGMTQIKLPSRDSTEIEIRRNALRSITIRSITIRSITNISITYKL